MSQNYIYLLEANGAYKIGRSSNVEKRMLEIDNSLSIKTTLIHQFPALKYDEIVLHKYFEDKRVGGEWFKLSDGDIELFKTIDGQSGVLEYLSTELRENGVRGRPEPEHKNFVSWLHLELEKRDWSYRELTRQAGKPVSHTHTSLIVSGQRNVSWDYAAAIARAFKMSPIAVFRIAGLLADDSNVMADKIIYHTAILPIEKQEQALEYIKYLSKTQP